MFDGRADPAGEALLRAERRRLRRAFAAILVAATPTALAQGCGEPARPPAATGTGGATHTDAGTDTGPDGMPDASADGATPDDAASDVDASCNATITAIDAATDGLDPCSIALPCGLPQGLATVGCDLYVGGMPFGCSLVPDAGCTADAYAPLPNGSAVIECPVCPGGGGRRPRGLRRARSAIATTPLGTYFARMAHDEAAAVRAFADLAGDLRAHGAPPALLRAAERSARDEARHARLMADEARLCGAPPPSPRIRRRTPRGIEAIARENAVEGCVHETFGALLLAWQATHAPSASLRRTFQRIAADETRHAALAWAVARWLDTRLDPAGRARVATARSRAVERLRRQMAPSLIDAAVGRPAPRAHAALVDGMTRRLGL